MERWTDNAPPASGVFDVSSPTRRGPRSLPLFLPLRGIHIPLAIRARDRKDHRSFFARHTPRPDLAARLAEFVCSAGRAVRQF
jgi:hypothetical protein